MSLRRFDGWEPAEVHECEYDETGRLARTVVSREPEWDAEERAWMLGLAMREAAECRKCGGDLNETLDYEWRWTAQPPLVCLRCAALQDAAKQSAKHPQHAAMIHRVKKAARPKPKKRR